ncbi:MAG: T9SS type A sorting domain-containing protein, partial [Saprospiraceae bacterium]
GLLVVPNDLSKVYPRLVYQHGTSGSKLEVPSYTANSGEGTIGLLFAGLGYVTMAPDYLGLGISKGFHPYVHAASEASVAMDMLRAVQQYTDQNGIHINSQLFLTGYSQGGHAAMALHRAIEQDSTNEFTVTAAAPMSGPYSISGVMRNLILTDAVYYYPAYIPNTVLSYQTVYGNLFTQISDIFRPAYVDLVTQFYAGQISLGTLNSQLITLLTSNEGACRPIKLFKDEVLQAIINDPNQPMNLALAKNDTYTHWIPEAPMRLFYCMADDQVPFLNSIVAGDSLTAAGAPDFLISDVNSTADHGGCVNPALTATAIFFAGFQQVTTDANTPANDWQLTMSPNPASTALNLQGIPTAGKLVVVDMSGRVVLNTYVRKGQQTIDVTGLENGLYLARFSAPGKNAWTEKLLIRR